MSRWLTARQPACRFPSFFFIRYIALQGSLRLCLSSPYRPEHFIFTRYIDITWRSFCQSFSFLKRIIWNVQPIWTCNKNYNYKNYRNVQFRRIKMWQILRIICFKYFISKDTQSRVIKSLFEIIKKWIKIKLKYTSIKISTSGPRQTYTNGIQRKKKRNEFEILRPALHLTVLLPVSSNPSWSVSKLTTRFPVSSSMTFSFFIRDSFSYIASFLLVPASRESFSFLRHDILHPSRARGCKAYLRTIYNTLNIKYLRNIFLSLFSKISRVI